WPLPPRQAIARFHGQAWSVIVTGLVASLFGLFTLWAASLITETWVSCRRPSSGAPVQCSLDRRRLLGSSGEDHLAFSVKPAAHAVLEQRPLGDDFQELRLRGDGLNLVLVEGSNALRAPDLAAFRAFLSSPEATKWEGLIEQDVSVRPTLN